ncbi:MAG: hypothetical protein QGI52_08065 [Alphaproteobacteria bacterium]|jgi:hypothetical protein|nr:hypothetical protein [Alphaproteobacteria bacterium]
MNRRRNRQQGDDADAEQRRITGLPGCECALRGQGDGQKHDSGHRSARSAEGCVNCH